MRLSVLIIYTPEAQESSVYMGKGLALVGLIEVMLAKN